MQSRITVILHPNTTRIDITLNDRVFNKEQYSFRRKAEAVGAEREMLDILNCCIIGVDKAETSKNKLSLEISEGMYPCEIIPAVILAIKKFVNEPDYNPTIHCDNRRYVEEPEYDEDGRCENRGVKEPKGSIDLGVDYIVWND